MRHKIYLILPSILQSNMKKLTCEMHEVFEFKILMNEPRLSTVCEEKKRKHFLVSYDRVGHPRLSGPMLPPVCLEYESPL